MLSWIRWWSRMLRRPGRPKQIVKVCWKQDRPGKMVFNSDLQQSFSHFPRVEWDIEFKWALFCFTSLEQFQESVMRLG